MLPCKNCKMKQCCSLIVVVALLLVPFPMQSLAAADIVLPEGTPIFLQLNNHLSTKANSEGDAFTAVVTEPVYSGGKIVIPKGSEVNGSISRIQRPGRFKGKAVMTLMFNSITVAGRGQLPVVASLTGVDPEGNRGVNNEGTIQGEGAAGRDAGRVLIPGMAGAGIGGVAGGGRGAAIGAGDGVTIGLASIFASRGKEIEMRRGAALSITLDKPLSIPPEVDETSARTR